MSYGLFNIEFFCCCPARAARFQVLATKTEPDIGCTMASMELGSSLNLDGSVGFVAENFGEVFNEK